MTDNVSKTQIDRLGNRLKKGEIKEGDLRLLDEYRRSFREAYELVVGAILSGLRLEPTGRPAKSTTSISEKLVRESIRLTQIQDIAGCRLVVPSILDQNRVTESLAKLFTNVVIVDRREKPSHGYRAVHAIVKVDDKLVEIQVRTSLQHVWAELSEKLSDMIDPTIKYGGGDESYTKILARTSKLVAEEELGELSNQRNKELISKLLAAHHDDPAKQKKLLDLQEEIKEADRNLLALRQNVFEILQDSIDTIPVREGDADAISD